MEILNTQITTKKSFFRNTFLFAGLAFIVTALVGYLAYLWISSAIDLELATGNNRFNSQVFSNRSNGGDMTKLYHIAITGIATTIISSILTLVWMFRIQTAGKLFIYTVYATTIISQGIGFGILFTVFHAVELIGIFGIAGGLFMLMGIIGYFMKDASHLLPYLLVGTIIVIVGSLVSFILFRVGVYNDKFYLFLTIGTGVLTLGWILFDVWSIKRTSQFLEMNGSSSDDMMYFRLMAFFAYKLFSDLISLIWTIARLYMRMKR